MEVAEIPVKTQITNYFKLYYDDFFDIVEYSHAIIFKPRSYIISGLELCHISMLDHARFEIRWRSGRTKSFDMYNPEDFDIDRLLIYITMGLSYELYNLNVESMQKMVNTLRSVTI